MRALTLIWAVACLAYGAGRRRGEVEGEIRGAVDAATMILRGGQ